VGFRAGEDIDLPKVIWDGLVVADCDETVVVEDSHYFSPDGIVWGVFRESRHQTICPWRGRATFFDLISENGVLETAAWSYRIPGNDALFIKGWMAFDRIAILRRRIEIKW